VGLDLPAEEDARLGFSPRSLELFSRGRHVAVYGRGEALPFEDDTFDAVFMIEVIEHVDGDAQAIREVRRVLKPGGVLIVTTPNGATFPVPAKYHLRHYSPEALASLIGAELKVEKLWQMFPDGSLWAESTRSVQKMLHKRRFLAVAWHCLAVWTYWLVTLGCFFTGRVKGTTTLCVVARKSPSPA
jgi:ubiquinone/menaquinone biosynthesis C-methylase UbiE